MTRVLVVQSDLDRLGGGNAVAAHALEALADDHDVSILTWQKPDLALVDRSYGTALQSRKLTFIEAPKRFKLALRLSQMRGALIQQHVLFRMARELGGMFDAVVSTSNEIDAGRPAVQYIHFPWQLRPRPEYDLRGVHRLPGVLRAYYGLADLIAHTSDARVAANFTLVNSAWTGSLYESRYRGPWSVLYPPVAGEWNARPWSERDDAVAIVGRISPEKEIERAMSIVGALGRKLTLRVIGFVDDAAYYRRLRESSPPWVEYHLDLPHRDLLTLLGRTRYGIHCMHEEHFGIVVAEMLRSGCIPFVRERGGAPEIVGDPRLTYSSNEDALAKLGDALGDPATREELRAHCAERASQFSVERFQRGFRDAVSESMSQAADSRVSSAPPAM